MKIDHMTEVVDKIKVVRPASLNTETSRTEDVSPAIQFEAGELIGYTSGTGSGCCGVWDFGVYNTSRPNEFANPTRTQRPSQWKYGDCPYDYFTEPLRSQFYALLNIGRCRGTSIDVPGTIVGEWFSKPPEEDPMAFGTFVVGEPEKITPAAQRISEEVIPERPLGIGAGDFGFKVEAPFLNPGLVTDAHCYEGELNGQPGYVYLELLDELTLAESHGIGSCPDLLPENYTVYYR